ncbi:hypothetical protein BDW66DRAFT_137699 [Aspergillus desertorum]
MYLILSIESLKLQLQLLQQRSPNHFLQPLASSPPSPPQGFKQYYVLYPNSLTSNRNKRPRNRSNPTVSPTSNPQDLDQDQPQGSTTTIGTMSTATPSPSTLPITTYHCRFCATLLVATTRNVSALPTRSKSAADGARILPLRSYDLPPDTRTSESSKSTSGNREQEQIQKHYTILLATNSRDRKPTLIRRSDGFEKRFFLRCGRCRIPVGYFLDEVHFPVSGGLKGTAAESRLDSAEGEREEEREDRAVYLLPGALMETEIMSEEEKMKAIDREWAHWFK